MAMIKIKVVNLPETQKTTTIEVPDDKPVDDVLGTIVDEMYLPYWPESELGFRYSLCRGYPDGKVEQIESNRTLEENGVRDGDPLQLVVLPLLAGRNEELERFRRVLNARTEGDTTLPPHVFFISGYGGIGKTWLVKAFETIAGCEPPFAGQWRISHVDWRRQREWTSALRVAPDQISPKDVLDVISAQIKGEWSNYGKVKDLIWQVRQALDREEGGDFSVLCDWEPDELPMLAGRKSSSKLAQRAGEFLRKCLGDREAYEGFCNLDRSLSSAFGQDLSTLSDKPILICLDAYEDIQAERIDYCLLDVIKYAGGHVVWVISGCRIPSGYREWPGSAVIAEKIELQALTDREIKCYFNQCVPDKPVSDADAYAIHAATRGFPLMVNLFLQEGWAKGVKPETITEVDPPSLPDFDREWFVKQIVPRFLDHFVNPRDKDAIYLLAMMRRQEDKKFLHSTLVQMLKEYSYQISSQLLTALEGRYSFILPEGEMDDALRRLMKEYLLSRREHTERERLSRIGCQVLKDKLTGITNSDTMPLRERWARRNWVETSLDLVHLAFWQTEDEDAGWREFTPRFLEALAHYNTDDTNWAGELLNVASKFKPYFSEDAKRRLRIFESQSKQADAPKQKALVDELTSLKDWLNDSDHKEERLAILKWQEGKWHFKAGDYLQALRCYQEAQAILPVTETYRLGKQFLESYLDIAWLLVQPKDEVSVDIEVAEVAAREAVELGEAIHLDWEEKGKMAKVYYAQATIWSKFKQYDEAIGPAFRAAKLDDKDSKHWKLLGLVYLGLGQLKEAAEAFEKVCSLNARELESYVKLGQIYYDLEAYEKALIAYQHAVEIKLENAVAQSGLGDVHFALGAYEEARDAYKRTVELVPENARAYANLANACFRLRRPQNKRAMKHCEDACKLDPNWSYPHYQLGRIHIRLGESDPQEFDKAIEELERAIRLDPQNAGILYWLGTAYYERGNYSKACDTYGKAAEVDQQFALAYYGKGRAHLIQGDFQKASEELKIAVELNPTEKRFHYYLGEASYGLQQYDAALAVCEHAKELDSRFIPVYCLLGDTYYAMQRYEDAAREYECALHLGTREWPQLQWSLVYSRLGEVYNIIREFSKSTQAYTKALSREPADAWLYYNRGLTFYVQHRYQEAIEDFRQAIQHSAEIPEFYSGLGAVYLSLRDFSEAEKFYQQAIERSQVQNPGVHLSLGSIYLYQGKRETAEAHLGSVIEIYGRSKVAPGAGDRCCYTLAQLSMAQTPMIEFQEWSRDLDRIRAAGRHHYLHEWLAMGELLAETLVPSSQLLDYLDSLRLKLEGGDDK